MQEDYFVHLQKFGENFCFLPLSLSRAISYHCGSIKILKRNCDGYIFDLASFSIRMMIEHCSRVSSALYQQSHFNLSLDNDDILLLT